MPKGIMGNGCSWSLIAAEGVSATEKETAKTNEFMPYRSSTFLVSKCSDPRSMKAKLFLAIIPIGIVAYAFTLFWDNLCRNSCKHLHTSFSAISIEVSRDHLAGYLWRSDFFRIRSGFCQSDPFRSDPVLVLQTPNVTHVVIKFFTVTLQGNRTTVKLASGWIQCYSIQS